MKNQNAFFLIFCLCLTAGVLTTYSIFVDYFNGHAVYEVRLSQMREEIEKEKLNSALLSYQIKDFQQTVAQLLPVGAKLVADSEMRNLASVVRAPASEDALDLSGVYYEKGKRYFKKNDYTGAILEFDKLLEKFPLSRHSVEARFFIAESYFLKNDFRNSLAQIDQMVTNYPQHDLTGYILLRMGQISEINNQTEEASEIYQTVLENFKNEDLQKQAEKLAKSINF